MSKKQATNTFIKGLLKDYHPLTVPADVMTDALNATIITMNGNEGILQNDMGNGKVERAFLPSGYVPVGMKEYGGIIYVASYNPITNKSLIGSFPSPERNIDLTENDKSPKNPLEFLNNNYTRVYKYAGFNNINDYQIGLGELTGRTDIFGEDKYIRAGDKFGFYFDNSEFTNETEVLSNFNNYRIAQGVPNEDSTYDVDNRVYRNKEVTLSIQVLDSNNNLRDITDLLKRYNTERNIIINTDSMNKEDAFNTGYFIQSNIGSDPVPADDRNKSALNTYNNKLYGKLFLVGKLNTIEYIDVSYRIITIPESLIEESTDSITPHNVQQIMFSPSDPIQSNRTPGDPIDNDLPLEESNPNQDDGFFDDHDNRTIAGGKVPPDEDFFEHDLEEPSVEPGDLTIIPSERVTLYKASEVNIKNIINPDQTTWKDTVEYRDDTWENNGWKLSYSEAKSTVENNSEYKYIFRCEFICVSNTSDLTSKKILTLIWEKGKPYSFLFLIDYYYNCPSECIVKPEVVIKSDNDNFDCAIKKLDTELYDKNLNLYRQRFIASVNVDLDNTIIHYLVIPKYNYSGTTYSLTHIAYEGAIDMLRLAQKPSINTWKYFYSENQMHLIWGLEDYLYDNDDIKDMKMEFYDYVYNGSTWDWNSTPSWTYNPYVRTTYSGGINEYLNFTDDGLLKGHIYKVKLSRLKNGSTEKLGERIMITTPIYNSLFNDIEDYESEEASESIANCNKIKIRIDANSDIINSSGVQLKTKGNLNPIHVGDASDSIQDCMDVYTITTTDKIDLNLDVDEKFPFDVATPNKVNYTLNITPDTDKGVSLKGNTDNWGDSYNNLNGSIDINLAGHTVNTVSGSVSGSVSDLNGNLPLTLKVTRDFNSILRFKYSQSKTDVGFKKYKNVKDYVIDQLKHTEDNTDYYDIYYLATGVEKDKEKYVGLFKLKVSFNSTFDELYEDIIEPGFIRDDRSSFTYFKEHDGNTIIYIDNIEENLKILLRDLSNKNIYLFTTIALYNKNQGDSNFSNALYDKFWSNNENQNSERISVGLRLTPDSLDNFDNIYSYLVWRDESGEIYFLNSLYFITKNSYDPVSGIPNITNTLISGLLGRFKDVFFKTNEQTTINGYKINDDEIVYNSDYVVDLFNELTLSGITINEGFKLNYLGNELDVVNNQISIGRDDVIFEIDTSDSSSFNTKRLTVTIPGVLDLVDKISDISELGVILDNNTNYFNITSGELLQDDFYIIKEYGINNKKIYGELNDKQLFADINNRFKIVGNDLYIKNYDLRKANSNYFIYSSADPTRIRMYISRVKSVNIPGFTNDGYYKTYLK